MAADFDLGKHQVTVEYHLEDATRGLDQLHVRVGIRLVNLGRQTGGPWLVASNTAVFDRYPHEPLQDGLSVLLRPKLRPRSALPPTR